MNKHRRDELRRLLYPKYDGYVSFVTEWDRTDKAIVELRNNVVVLLDQVDRYEKALKIISQKDSGDGVDEFGDAIKLARNAILDAVEAKIVEREALRQGAGSEEGGT